MVVVVVVVVAVVAVRIADESDMVNGDEIRNHLVEPTDIVQSIDDPALRSDDMNDGFISWSEV